jgi:hypothetical protein
MLAQVQICATEKCTSTSCFLPFARALGAQRAFREERKHPGEDMSTASLLMNLRVWVSADVGTISDGKRLKKLQRDYNSLLNMCAIKDQYDSTGNALARLVAIQGYHILQQSLLSVLQASLSGPASACLCHSAATCQSTLACAFT